MPISEKAINGPQASLFNPTIHAYFNLSEVSNLTSHEIKINSQKYLQLNSELIPTGKMLLVSNTPYDFRDFKNLATTISDNADFDDAFVIKGPEKENKKIAILREKGSGRQIRITSESNGLVMYTMSKEQLGVKFVRDQRIVAQPSEAVALETQILPDAINNAGFGDIVLLTNSTKTYNITFTFQ